MYAIRTAAAPEPLGAYSQGASAARYVFVSAQLPQDPLTGEVIEASVGAMAARCLMNVEAVLQDAGLSLDDACSLTVWLTDLADAQIVNEVLAERLSKPYPARNVVGAASLPLGAPIQVSAVACR